jgi:hypothetical protein
MDGDKDRSVTYAGNREDCESYLYSLKCFLQTKAAPQYRIYKMGESGRPDESADRATAEAWNEANEKLAAYVGRTLRGRAIEIVRPFEDDGLKTIEALKRDANPENSTTTLFLFRNLVTLKIRNTLEDPSLFFIQLERIQRLLDARGEKISDKFLAAIATLGIMAVKDYEATCTSLAITNANYDTVKEQVQAKYISIRGDGDARKTQVPGGGAFAASFATVCHNCKRKGHYARDCRAEKRGNRAPYNSRKESGDTMEMAEFAF